MPDWTPDSLLAHFTQVLAERDAFIRLILTERDVRFEQRFAAQQDAIESARNAALSARDADRTSLNTDLAQRDTFLERLANERDKQVQFAFAAAERAVAKAEVANEKRFDSVNEFRAQLADQASTFLPRKEFDVQLAGVSTEVDALRRNVDSSSYVTRELFDRYVKEQSEIHGRIFDQATVTYNDIANMKGRSAAYVVALSVFFTVVTIAATILTRVL